MNFCEALFDGHDRKTADIDNLHYYLFGRLDSATDPVILAVAVGLWVQDGNPFPEPNAVQRCLLRTRQILDTFLAQLDRMDYYLEKAEEIMDLYHGMQDCAPEIEYHEREMQRRPLAN